MVYTDIGIYKYNIRVRSRIRTYVIRDTRIAKNLRGDVKKKRKK